MRVSETSGTILNIQHSNYRGPRRIDKERVWENFWRDCRWIFPQHGKGNSQSSPRISESHTGWTQGETHQEHTNQTNKD